MCVDVGKTSSANYLHLMKAVVDSSVSEHAIKVRKQYTITKQRQRWTEDEHNKFLEALKLYGRAWRRIEDHIGSKTTVQIRSHAQKFFSKVERESSSNSPGIVKAIEIPPPRPKKKPSHPYPRKLGHLCSRKGTVVERPLWSSVPKLPVFEQESKSPTSVLSALESDTYGTTNSNSLKHCMSPVSSAGRSGTIDEILCEQGSASKSSLTSAIDKDNQSGPSAVEVNDMSMMEVDLSIQDPVCSKEATVTGEQVTSLKLFGRTVIVDNLPQESFTSKTVLECEKSLFDHNSIDLGTQKFQGKEKFAAFLYEGRGESNPYGVIPPMAYCLPSHEKITSSSQAKMVPLPCWWALYGGMHLPFSSPQSTELDQCLPQSMDDQFVGNDSTLKESSQTGSSISSSCESTAHANEKEPAPALKLRPSKNSAFSSLKPYSVNSSKGFVPYKRCAVEKELLCRQVACGEVANEQT